MTNNQNIVKLSQRQASLLQAIELRAHSTLSATAHALNLRIHTTRNEYNRLKELKVLKGIIPLIDVSQIGYDEWGCYLSLSCENDKIRRKAEQWIAQNSLVSWFTQAGGSYQYYLSLCVTDTDGVASFFNALASSFGHIIQAKHLATIISFSVFGKKYLSDAVTFSPLSYSKGPTRLTPTQIDTIDKKILNTISEQTFATERQIASALAIPRTTFDHRIARLEQRKIIVGYVHSVDTRCIGVQTYKALLFTRGMSNESKKELYKWACHHPNVVTYIECVGPWDIELRIEVWAPENAAEVTRDVLDKFGKQITAVELVPIFGFIKNNNFPSP